MSIRHIHARPGQHIVVHRDRKPRCIHHYHTADHSEIKWIITGALILVGVIVVCYYWQVILGILILGLFLGGAAKK